MGNLVHTLKKLNDLGVKLQVENEVLKVFSPPGAMTKDLQHELKLHKSQIMALLGEISAPAIQNTSTAECYELSEGQKALYVIQKMRTERMAYNMPICIRVNENFDIKFMQAACDDLIFAFPILSARIIENSGKLQIQENSQFKLMLEPHENAPILENHLMDYLADRIAQPFNLNEGPLIRAQITPCADGYVILFTVHHLVFDGMSIPIMVQFLLSRYKNHSEGKHLPLLVSRGYSQFVQWEKTLLASTQGNVHRRFWRDRLSGDLPNMQFPAFRIQGMSTTAADITDSTHTLSLTLEQSQWISQFASQNTLQPSVIFLGLFQLLMAKMTTQDDAVVVMPVITRFTKESLTDIGYYFNIVPIRTVLDSSLNILAFFRKVQGVMLDAVYHAAFPSSLILEPSESDKSANVFHTFFAYQNILRRDSNESLPMQRDLDVRFMECSPPAGDFGLSFEVFEDQENYTIQVQTDPQRYKPTLNNLVTEAFAAMLNDVAQDATRPIKSYSICSPVVYDRVTKVFNNTKTEVGHNRCMHSFFLESAKLYHDSIAVRFLDQQWSYGLLEYKTRQLAVYLRNNGIGPDKLVAICMERSLEMLLAIYAIWRAGGAYVPVDPDYPDERIAYMLNDASCSIVLTQARLRERVASVVTGPTQLLALDDDWNKIERDVANDVDHFSDESIGVNAGHLAYVIYTSGSTGKPKGVMIEHSALVNRIMWMQNKYQLNTTDVILQKTPFSFDVSVWEFAWPMSVGCQMVFVEPGGHKDIEHLQNIINREGVTTLHFVPSMFNTYLATSTQDCASVRRIFCSGEALGIHAVKNCYQSFPNAALHNLYGPTEAAIDVTAFDCSELATDFVPIGAPIDNIQIYILDNALNTVPVSVPGELHIAGVGLARGYLNRPELTQEKFIANPFTNGQRMYKSGDLARWMPDGNIEYCGRMDGQVKLRGFRLEMGEVEVALNRHPNIQESVVLIRGADEDKMLIAFYVASKSGSDISYEITKKELVDFLRTSLPDFMIPSQFIAMTDIPVTANGKADRKKLAALDLKFAMDSREIVVPRNSIERELTEIWADILKLDINSIGIRDPFFELGGNSLLAVRMNGLVHARLGKALPLAALFNAPDIESIARVISGELSLDNQLVVAITPATESNQHTVPIFAFPGAGGNVMSLQPLGAAFGQSQPFFALQARPQVNEFREYESVEQLAKHYLEAIKVIQRTGPYRLYGYSNGGVLAFEVARQLVDSGETIGELVLLDSVLPEIRSIDVVDGAVEVCQFIAASLGKEFPLDSSQLSSIPETERCDFLYPYMRELGFDLTEAQFKTYYDAAYANNLSCREYCAQPLKQVTSAILFRLDETDYEISEDYGWSQFLPASPKIFRIAAKHYSFLEKTFADQIADAIGSAQKEYVMSNPNE